MQVLTENLTTDKFSKITDSNKKGYKLQLTGDDIKNIETKLLETLKNDQTTLDKLNEYLKEQKNSGTAKIWTCGCPVFYAQGRKRKLTAVAVCAPRGEYGKINLPYSIRRI